jgi:alkylation response protein AidB-like acyl-CoA dehydrogenase
MASYAMELLGAEGLPVEPNAHEAMYIAIALKIARGTEEVLLNQIVERVLAMPSEQRIARTSPSQIYRHRIYQYR